MTYKPPDLPYYGPVAHTSGTGNLPINRVVIHCTAGSDAKGAQGTARYFQDPAATGSAHYIVDSDESIQCAYDNVVCWHAPPNTHSLGIEMECSLAGDGAGHWTRDDHVAMMHRAAKLTAQKCIQYDVPIVKLTPADLVAGKRGVCGHWDVTQAFGQSTHTDPERYFPWSQFMSWVRAEAALITGDSGSAGSTPTSPTGELTVAQFDDIMAKLNKIDTDAGNRYSEMRSALGNLINAEAGRYSDLRDALGGLINAENSRATDTKAELDAIQAAIAALTPATPPAGS